MPQRLLRNSTVKVAELFQKVITELASLRKGVITVEFILMALLEQKDSIALKIFDEMGLATEDVRRKILDRILEDIGSIPNIQFGVNAAAMKVSKEVQMLFETADQQRAKLGDSYISTTSIFLACFDEKIASTKKLLMDEGVKYDDVLRALSVIRGNAKITNKNSESRSSALDEYTIDITALARKKLLDPVIGREKEIQRVIEILSRRKKNNPILVGQPGVGKTVIIEGLAQQIANSEVPTFLLNKRIISLEIGTLIAGAKMQGEFEERLKSIKDEVIAAAGEIILFIDEIHTVVGAGRTGGSLDASNMLKPALAKGLLQCAGATTLKEYKQFIESDKALERRFQLVKVEEPSVEEAKIILHGLKESYERHHEIAYEHQAIEQAVNLSHKYIESRCLPDKAIDLIDEAGAAKRIKVVYTPPKVRKLESKKQDLEAEKIKAFNAQDFERMAHFQMEIAHIEDELKLKRDEFLKNHKNEERLVTEQDIAAIVSKLTGIPAVKMIAEEADKLMHLEDLLRQRVIGQDHVLELVANAIRRNRSGLRRVDKPIASFLFLGPTGVGKTELAKALAENILDDESKIIRLDMSEYMERHDVSKLIGSPPGYIGYGEGGQLTEKVKHQPYSIVLFDEFEKAHPDVYNVLLPLLDEGWLTDAEGQRVSFRNCIIIGTSNLGSHILSERKKKLGIAAKESKIDLGEDHREIMNEVRKFLRPEFINRLDEVVIFNRLGEKELKNVLDLLIDDLQQRLSVLGVELSFTEEAKDLFIKNFDVAHYGARPLKRKLEVLVENKVAALLIENPGHQGLKFVVFVKEDEINVDLIIQSGVSEAKK